VDVERAEKESPFGTTVAHGDLTLSLVNGLRLDLMRSTGSRARRQLRLEQGPLPGAARGLEKQATIEMELAGLEPATSWVRSRRSPS
jgi:hypothetical protein